jgi:dCMP deaminase
MINDMIFDAKWCDRFLALAHEVARWSKDPSSKVGAVVVNDQRQVVGMGYNGFPRGTSDHPDIYANRPEKYRRVVHAEVNAVLNATSSTKGATIFVTHPPCSQCMALLIQAGVKAVVCQEPDAGIRERLKESFESAQEMAEEADIEFIVRLGETI